MAIAKGWVEAYWTEGETGSGTGSGSGSGWRKACETTDEDVEDVEDICGLWTLGCEID
jgi:hypothetical protein